MGPVGFRFHDRAPFHPRPSLVDLGAGRRTDDSIDSPTPFPEGKRQGRPLLGPNSDGRSPHRLPTSYFKKAQLSRWVLGAAATLPYAPRQVGWICI